MAIATFRSQTSSGGSVWALARRQHEIVTDNQLRELGYGRAAIRHRIEKGRLHPLYRGVYAVGNPRVSRCGELIAAVLACGPGAVLSHECAAELWRIRTCRKEIEVTIPAGSDRRPRGVRVHRRVLDADDIARHRQIPITSPIRTILDLAARLPIRPLEAMVNEADGLDLIRADSLLEALEPRSGRPGVKPLRALLERATLRLTDSELERLFLPIAASAGLPTPLTQHRVNGYRVDFFFPTLGLVVEADGLRYHRTAAQQTTDARRDQAHAAAGLERLRFTHFQIRYEPHYVKAVLRRIARRRLGILEV